MYSITFSETDHITFQLYEASTNALKKKSRKKTFIIFLVLSFVVIISGILNEDDFLMYYGIFCAALVIFFGNIYLRWVHKRHYIKHVKNKLKGQFEELVQIGFDDAYITARDRVVDSKLKISEITQVDEIKTHYFLKMSTGTYLMIPKNNPELNDRVTAMIKNFNIPHVVDLDWKWR